MNTRCLGLRQGVVQRSRGQSAAIRSDYQRLGAIFDGSTVKLFRGSLVEYEHEIFRPHNAPSWAADADALWHQAALSERRRDAVEARTLDITLPRAFPRDALRDSVSAIAEEFVKLGVAVQSDLHITAARDTLPNPHVHYIISVRAIGPEGFSERKCAELETLCTARRGRAMRDRVCAIINAVAAQYGLSPPVHAESNFTLGLKPVYETRLPRRVFRAPDAPSHKAILADLDATRDIRNLDTIAAEIAEIDEAIATIDAAMTGSSENFELDEIPKVSPRHSLADQKRSAPVDLQAYLKKIDSDYERIHSASRLLIDLPHLNSKGRKPD